MNSTNDLKHTIVEDVSAAEHFFRAPNARTSALPIASREHSGGKGAGLVRLPLRWYPTTLVISPELSTVVDRSISIEHLRAVPGLPNELANLASESPSGRLLLRSSAQGESIADRGAYISVPITPTVDGLANGMNEVWEHASIGGYHHPVGFLIQPLINAVGEGHLSNEHRVSRESTRWLLQSDGAPAFWQVQKAEPASDGELSAPTRTKLDYELRKVARRLSDNLSRMHLEWLWDGQRAWVVQADAVPPIVGPPPGERFKDVVAGERVAPSELRAWSPLTDQPTEAELSWPKVRAIDEFRNAGLGSPDFWILSGADVRADTQSDLAHDFQLLCNGHLLIRADVKGVELSPYLRRSDALIDPTAALEYLNLVANTHTQAGNDAADLCFIAHRFTRARASAWAVAWPNRADVRVDSLWGLADGLGYLPHDTAWFNTDTGHMQRSINGKTQFLDTHNGTDWHYETTPTEWIWKASVTSDQLRTIATATQRISHHRGEPVVVLWFVGMLDGYDSDCLAWVTAKGPETMLGELGRYPEHLRYTIKTMDDLRAFAPTGQPTVLLLEPAKDLLRSTEFLELVADTANRDDLPVELAGSPLAHAYYQLQRAGVTVLCIDSPPAPTREFNKLVRDGIIPRVESQGEQVVSYQATENEHRNLLKRKLVEEAIEVLEAEGEGAILEELADVEEVLLALRTALGIDEDAVAEIREVKHAKRGGFNDRMVLIQTGGQPESATDELFGTDGLRRPLDQSQIEVSDSRLTISLIPPPPERRAPFSITLGDCEVRGRYRSHHLMLEVSTPERTLQGGQELEGLFPESDGRP